jgi:site-specific DNA-methyltransferase (adenine-specific)
MKLYKGDCLEVMKSIPDNSIDAIITDPPYGTTACKWDSVISFDLMWEQLNRIIKPNGAIVLFGSEPFSSALRMSNIKDYKYDWIWEKTKASAPMLANKMPMRRHENISIFYKKLPTYNPQMVFVGIKDKRKTFTEISINKNFTSQGLTTKAKKDNGYRHPNTVQIFNNSNKTNLLHPTQKPIELMEYLIKTYTNENETVLDFTMGSGSTGVACVNTKRNFIGIEQDEKYFSIAEQRIKEAKYKLF